MNVYEYVCECVSNSSNKTIFRSFHDDYNDDDNNNWDFEWISNIVLVFFQSQSQFMYIFYKISLLALSIGGNLFAICVSTLIYGANNNNAVDDDANNNNKQMENHF